MIFIAKSADFSANKIGIVKINYSDLTKSVLASYSKVLTTEQKSNLDDMLNSLNASGILAKITKLYLPILADNLAEAFVNIASPQLTRDIIPNSNYWALKSGGIYNAAPTNTADAALNLTLDGALNNTDFHILNFNTENYTQAVDSFNPYGANVLYLAHSWNTAGGSQYTGVTLSGNFNIGNITPDICSLFPVGSTYLMSLGYKNTLKGYSFMQNTAVKSYNPVEQSLTLTSAYTQANISGVIDLSGYMHASMLKSQGLISIGVGLTSSEIIAYSDSVKPFMASMGVTVE